MEVTEITVIAGRVFPHPCESFSNLRPEIAVKAKLAAGEDWELATRALQAQAEKIVEDHKRNLVESIERIAEMKRNEQLAANLASQIRSRGQTAPADVEVAEPDDCPL